MMAHQDYDHRDQQGHPNTIMLCKSRSIQPELVPEDHRLFMEEAYNEAICFKMLRDMGSSDPVHVKYIFKKIRKMAQECPNLLMETIHDYFKDNPEMPIRHKFRLLQALKAVIAASNSLEEAWRKSFMQLALENMTKSTELEDTYQDAASNVLVALCRYSWREVAQYLETELLTGVFPHRSLLYVMGILYSQEELLNKEDRRSWNNLLTQMATKSVPFLNIDVWSNEMLWTLTKPSQTQQDQNPEKAFLFTYYGLILQAEDNSANVRTHVRALLDTSHQWPKQREGIALTVGLAATRHLDDVWAVLDQFGPKHTHQVEPEKLLYKGTSKGLSEGHAPDHPVQGFEDLRWKWASSTILLCYGQMAARAKTRILPWVDNILSRMIFYFRDSSWDETLKQSFLTAILMLVAAISRSEGAHSYEFSQTCELMQCLMVLMEKEQQDSLCTASRQQAMQVISSLCALRPPMDTDRKSRLLSTCLHSVLALPLMDTLEKHTCLFLEPPNIQMLYSQTMEALDHMLQSFMVQSPTGDELYFLLSHLNCWLASEKTHERQRAAHCCLTLLKFSNHKCCLHGYFRQIGQLVAMLGIVCQDPDRTTQCFSLEAVGHLYQILVHHKGDSSQEEREIPEQLSQLDVHGDSLGSSEDQPDTCSISPEITSQKDSIFQLSSSQAIKAVMTYLSRADLDDLIWIFVENLGSTSPFRVEAAADLLLLVVQEHGAKLMTVTNIGRAIYHHICTIRIPQAKENILRAITLLARNHTPELVAAFLDFSVSLDSHAFCLWRALGAEQPVSHLVLATLLTWLQKRTLPPSDSDSSSDPKKAYLYSLAAMNTIHELQFAREYKKAMREAYPQLLLALLAQVHFTLELTVLTGPQAGLQAKETVTPSPQSTSLEALKSLLSTTGHWHDFAHLELQGAWEQFNSMSTYPQAVGLLARAMVQNGCRETKAVLCQLLSSLQSQQERERKTAMLVLTEFLYSPTLLEVLSKQAALTVLAQMLQDPGPEIRVTSLQGLGNVLFHPGKEILLRGQLSSFLDGFFQNSESVVVGIMGMVSDVLHRLGTQGAGSQSLSVAVNARSFFDDERDGIRAAAMALFGNLVATMAGQDLSALRAQVYQSMVPLLLHTKDHCPAVTTQAKFAFYRCAVLLRWHLRYTLFCTLAWERGLSARHFLWTCLMTHSQEEFSIHLAQAISYLHSHHHYIKTWAALFIGYTTCYHPKAVSQVVNDVDTKLLLCAFKDLKKDPEPGIREFATRQLSFFKEMSARSNK